MIDFVNLTPHAIKVVVAGITTTFDPSGDIARVSTVRAPSDPIGSFPVVSQNMGDVTGIPAPVAGTIFIVSGMVRGALKGTRPDVVSPDTDQAIRNDKGHVVAVPGFVR